VSDRQQLGEGPRPITLRILSPPSAGLAGVNLFSFRWYISFTFNFESPKISKPTRVTQADLEDLVLSGKLFTGGGSGSSSPRRSPSPDAPKWPGNNDADDYSDDHGSPRRLPSAAQPHPGAHDSGGVGVGVPGRTGVKGVIRDRNEAERGIRDKRAIEVKELNKRMEKASLTGMTYLEEKALERNEGDDELDEIRFARIRGKGQTGRGGGGPFGHLREVGLDGFLKAVEMEERHVWVVLHLYHPVRIIDIYCLNCLNPLLQSLDRCESLDNTLGKLAREHASIKFLRAKASAVGFASGPSAAPKRTTLSPSTKRSIKSGTIREEDEDDPYGEAEYNEKEHEDEDDEPDFDDEDNVDTDMLPTMLVYRGGDLVYNWVRVDWEAGKAGVEDLLVK
jgi:hypothetical protein